MLTRTTRLALAAVAGSALFACSGSLLAQQHDPETRQLAENIIKAQEAEIAIMNTWLQKKGAK